MKKTIIISLLSLALLTVLVFIYWWQKNNVPVSQSNLDENITLNQTPSSELQSKIGQTVATVMNDRDPLQYIGTQKNPSNFTIGKVTEINDGAWQIDTPKEWERPVYIFQLTNYIDELCEVYEYEVDVRNNQLVEIHIVYPKDIQNLNLAEHKEKCGSHGSLYAPLKTEAEIKDIAMEFLRRSVDNFDQIEGQFVYVPSKKDVVNIASAHEWMWQDKSYKLPEGLTGDVYNYPTIRVIISSGGKLIHYFNSLGLFKN